MNHFPFQKKFGMENFPFQKKNWNGKWFIEYIGQYLIPTDDSHGVYPVPERLWRSSKMRENTIWKTKVLGRNQRYLH